MTSFDVLMRHINALSLSSSLNGTSDNGAWRVRMGEGALGVEGGGMGICNDILDR